MCLPFLERNLPRLFEADAGSFHLSKDDSTPRSAARTNASHARSLRVVTEWMPDHFLVDIIRIVSRQSSIHFRSKAAQVIAIATLAIADKRIVLVMVSDEILIGGSRDEIASEMSIVFETAFVLLTPQAGRPRTFYGRPDIIALVAAMDRTTFDWNPFSNDSRHVGQ